MTRNESIELTLARFQFVQWDRFVVNPSDDGHMAVFGWIERKDGKRDYASITFKEARPVAAAATSAKYSKIIADALDLDHAKCERVEGTFTRLGNVVRMESI